MWEECRRSAASVGRWFRLRGFTPPANAFRRCAAKAAAALAVVLVAVSASGVLARDVYVDNLLGDDTATGRRGDVAAADRPVRTIGRALRLVERGGRINLAPNAEPYREMISLSDVNHRGFPDQPLVIRGNGAILDGTVVAEAGAWRHERDGLFALRPRRLAYQQLVLEGEPLRHVRTKELPAAAVALEPLQWTLRTDRILFRPEDGRVPDQYALRHAGLQTGITLYNTEHVRIEDLVIQGFQQDGINAHELVRNCRLVRVECRANGRGGISVGGVSRVEIHHTNCYDNGRAQLRLEGQARVTAERSEFSRDDPDAPWLEVRGGRAVVDGTAYEAGGMR